MIQHDFKTIKGTLDVIVEHIIADGGVVWISMASRSLLTNISLTAFLVIGAAALVALIVPRHVVVWSGFGFGLVSYKTKHFNFLRVSVVYREKHKQTQHTKKIEKEEYT
jgi:hypothetical protein